MSKPTLLTPAELQMLCQQNKINNVLVLFNEAGNVASIKLEHNDSRIHKNSFWHQTSYDELREFINDGLTYSQIGDLFDVSKSMVQYKINKLLPAWRQKQGLE